MVFKNCVAQNSGPQHISTKNYPFLPLFNTFTKNLLLCRLQSALTKNCQFENLDYTKIHCPFLPYCLWPLLPLCPLIALWLTLWFSLPRLLPCIHSLFKGHRGPGAELDHMLSSLHCWLWWNHPVYVTDDHIPIHVIVFPEIPNATRAIVEGMLPARIHFHTNVTMVLLHSQSLHLYCSVCAWAA